MGSTGFLKTVKMGGFDKKDVLNYVDELNAKINRLENELNEKNGYSLESRIIHQALKVQSSMRHVFLSQR